MTSKYVASTIIALITSFSSFPALAQTYTLKSTNKSGWDLRNEGTYSSSGECEKARKQYLKDNPDRSAVCM